MILETFPVGPLQCNCTILGDEETGEAIVVDPGDEVTAIYRRLTTLGLKLKQILVTHGHIDHVGGALKLKRLTGAPILLNQDDLPQLKMMDTQASWLGVDSPEIAPPDESLSDGLVVGLENYPAQVLHTPGHTQGSVCLHFAPLNLLIVGDTLFSGSIG
ncbi:MAG: MBL fold metallo-hydrolase, partial [Terracidiphilus sp.]